MSSRTLIFTIVGSIAIASLGTLWLGAHTWASMDAALDTARAELSARPTSRTRLSADLADGYAMPHYKSAWRKVRIRFQGSPDAEALLDVEAKYPHALNDDDEFRRMARGPLTESQKKLLADHADIIDDIMLATRCAELRDATDHGQQTHMAAGWKKCTRMLLWKAQAAGSRGDIAEMRRFILAALSMADDFGQGISHIELAYGSELSYEIASAFMHPTQPDEGKAGNERVAIDLSAWPAAELNRLDAALQKLDRPGPPLTRSGQAEVLAFDTLVEHGKAFRGRLIPHPRSFFSGSILYGSAIQELLAQVEAWRKISKLEDFEAKLAYCNRIDTEALRRARDSHNPIQLLGIGSIATMSASLLHTLQIRPFTLRAIRIAVTDQLGQPAELQDPYAAAGEQLQVMRSPTALSIQSVGKRGGRALRFEL